MAVDFWTCYIWSSKWRKTHTWPWRGIRLQSVCLSVLLSNWNCFPVNSRLLFLLVDWLKHLDSEIKMSSMKCIFFFFLRLEMLTWRILCTSNCAQLQMIYPPKLLWLSQKSLIWLCFLFPDNVCRHWYAFGNVRAGSPVEVQDQKYHGLYLNQRAFCTSTGRVHPPSIVQFMLVLQSATLRCLRDMWQLIAWFS